MKNQISNIKYQKLVFEIILLISFITYIVLICRSPVFAASINLSDGTPNVISSFNQEYQANVSISIAATDGTIYYLRGVFYKSNTNNYCGFTWNGSTWYNGPYTTNEGWKNLLPVTVASSSASAILKAKLDSNDSDCKDSGSYNFKVQRYTQGGSATFDSQNEQSLTVNIPSPTSTPTNVSTSTPMSSPLNTPSPSNTPKPQNSPTTKPTLISTNSTPTRFIPSQTMTEEESSSSGGEVLGKSVNQATESQNLNTTSTPKTNTSQILILFLIGGGFIFIALALFLSYRKKAKHTSLKIF